MKFEDFKNKFYSEIVDKKPKTIRMGQALMNFLYDVWPEEYIRISSTNNPDKDTTDCYYRNELINNTFAHLEKVWQNFPK